MADLRITQLPELLPGQLGADDPLPIADLSASTTKKIKAVDLIADGINLLPAGSIPGDKVNITIGIGAVDTDNLADKAVTAPKLADNSTAVFGVQPAAGEYIGQIWVDPTGVTGAAAWNGSSWQYISGVTGINGDTSNIVNIYATPSIADPAVFDLSVDLDSTTAAGQFLAGPEGGPGVASYRRIASPDLPTAGASKGAVAVAGNGLAMAGDLLSIDNVVAPNAVAGHLVQYDEYGLVTAGGTIKPSDLPLATDTDAGAMLPGSGLSAGVNGVINHTNSVVAGTATKVSFDTEGHVVQADPLLATDIPDLDASKITTGTFGSTRIEDSAITAAQLADYAISYIQEAEPASVDPGSIGMLWLQESTAQLRMWNGNSWFAVGLGRLVQDNLRWGGLVDASTGLITAVTKFGLTAGLAVGTPVPDARDQLGGLYVVVEVAGGNIGQTPGVVYDEGDWCLCIDQANGWTRIDTLSGGGSGGASRLDDLLDVTLTSPATGQVLRFNAGSGQWVNVSSVALGTELATPSTLIARDANGDAAVNKITAAVFDIDALPALP